MGVQCPSVVLQCARSRVSVWRVGTFRDPNWGVELSVDAAPGPCTAHRLVGDLRGPSELAPIWRVGLLRAIWKVGLGS